MTCCQAAGERQHVGARFEALCQRPASRIFEDVFGDRFGYCTAHLPLLWRLVRYGFEVREVTD